MKAKDLEDDFYKINDMGGDLSGTNPYISRYFAKQCALLCTQKVIEALDYHQWQNRHITEEWNEIKEELLNKLEE